MNMQTNKTEIRTIEIEPCTESDELMNSSETLICPKCFNKIIIHYPQVNIKSNFLYDNDYNDECYIKGFDIECYCKKCGGKMIKCDDERIVKIYMALNQIPEIKIINIEEGEIIKINNDDNQDDCIFRPAQITFDYPGTCKEFNKIIKKSSIPSCVHITIIGECVYAYGIYGNYKFLRVKINAGVPALSTKEFKHNKKIFLETFLPKFIEEMSNEIKIKRNNSKETKING